LQKQIGFVLPFAKTLLKIRS